MGIQPQLSVHRGRAAVEFYRQVFGAIEVYRVGGTDENPELVSQLSIGATEVASVIDEHGWRLGRVRDPFGHHWEIGKPLAEWPPHA